VVMGRDRDMVCVCMYAWCRLGWGLCVIHTKTKNERKSSKKSRSSHEIGYVDFVTRKPCSSSSSSHH
jgi:hypothetical protein